MNENTFKTKTIWYIQVVLGMIVWFQLYLRLIWNVTIVMS